MPRIEGLSRIFVVEDEPYLLESIIDILTYEGFDVSGVKNGSQAIELIRRQLPSLVITDVRMPEMDGYQLVKLLRSDPNTIEIPVILLSGHVEPDFVNEGLALGANRFIRKPFRALELINSVDQLLATVGH